MDERRGLMPWLAAKLGLRKAPVELRTIATLPWSTGAAAPSVVTIDRALSLIPFFACVRILADAIASLPLQPYRRLGEKRMPMPSDPQLIASPSARGTLFEWLHKCVVSIAMRGNAYGLIVARDGFGFPTTVEWLNPDEVYVDELKPVLPRYFWLGREVPREDIVHIAWFTQPGKVVGLSPVGAFARSIGVGLNASDYGAAWFNNGGQPLGIFKNATRTVARQEGEEISDRLVQRFRVGKPLVYGSDWDYTALTVTPEESQFIETMRLNATQIASIFGVPPERVGGETGSSLTYSTVEQNQLNFVEMTLRPWLVRLELAFSALLPERQYVKFNVDALVRADLKTRYEAHHLALTDGWKTIDEVRDLEELPPMPAKDKPQPPAPPEQQPPPEQPAQPPAPSGTNGNPANGKPVNGKQPEPARS